MFICISYVVSCTAVYGTLLAKWYCKRILHELLGARARNMSECARGKCVNAHKDNSGDWRFIVAMAPSMLAKLCVRTQTMAAQETVNPAANKIV